MQKNRIDTDRKVLEKVFSDSNRNSKPDFETFFSDLQKLLKNFQFVQEHYFLWRDGNKIVISQVNHSRVCCVFHPSQVAIKENKVAGLIRREKEFTNKYREYLYEERGLKLRKVSEYKTDNDKEPS